MPRHPPCALNNLTTHTAHNTTPQRTSSPEPPANSRPQARHPQTPNPQASHHTAKATNQTPLTRGRNTRSPKQRKNRRTGKGHRSHTRRSDKQDARVHYAIHKQQTANQPNPPPSHPITPAIRDTPHTGGTSRGWGRYDGDRSCPRKQASRPFPQDPTVCPNHPAPPARFPLPPHAHDVDWAVLPAGQPTRQPE